jgi:Xaa-Pro aminopeptidase
LNTIYVSGLLFDLPVGERPAATAIPIDSEPFMILDELSINLYQYGLEKNRHWIRDIRHYDEHPRIAKRRYYTQEFPQLLSEALEERGIVKGRIGVDRSESTLEAWLKPYLPDLEVVDATKLLREMRLIKDEYELDLIRKGAELSDWGQEKMKEAIKEGKSHVGIGYEVAHVVAEEAARRYPADYSIEISTVGFTGTGPEEGASPYGWCRPNGRKLQKRDSLPDEVSVRLNKYWAENERTFFVEEPSEKQKKFFDVITEAQTRAIETCVAGNKVSDIDAAALRVIEDAGMEDYVLHRTGHGIGLGGHEYWEDMSFNHRVLKKGMVTTVEPALYLRGLGGFRHSDTVIIGDNRPEVTTRYTKRLEDLIVHA